MDAGPPPSPSWRQPPGQRIPPGALPVHPHPPIRAGPAHSPEHHSGAGQAAVPVVELLDDGHRQLHEVPCMGGAQGSRAGGARWGGHGQEEQGGHGREEQGCHRRVEHGGGVTSGRNRGDHGGWSGGSWAGEVGGHGREERGGGGHRQEHRGHGWEERGQVTGGRGMGGSRTLSAVPARHPTPTGAAVTSAC